MTKRYGLVIDLDRCIGCHTCTIACKLENGFSNGSGIRVETKGGARPDTPEGKHPQLTMHFLPVPCMHCNEPPCRDVCPLEAISRRGDGIVSLDQEKCDGCQACLSVCPYDALVYDAGSNVVRKCSFCAHRVDEGLEPFCVECCETEAIYFGDLGNRASSASKVISRRNVTTLRPETGTKPNVHYCPTREGRIE